MILLIIKFGWYKSRMNHSLQIRMRLITSSSWRTWTTEKWRTSDQILSQLDSLKFKNITKVNLSWRQNTTPKTMTIGLLFGMDLQFHFHILGRTSTKIMMSCVGLPKLMTLICSESYYEMPYPWISTRNVLINGVHCILRVSRATLRLQIYFSVLVPTLT